MDFDIHMDSQSFRRTVLDRRVSNLIIEALKFGIGRKVSRCTWRVTLAVTVHVENEKI